jgi:hypothetical protein
VFTIVTLIALVGAIAVLFVDPTLPRIAVDSSHLEYVSYDGSSISLKLSLGVVAENHSPRATVIFTDVSLHLLYHDVVIAVMTEGPVEVSSKSSCSANYTMPVWNYPLDSIRRAELQDELHGGFVHMSLAGRAMIGWKVGRVVAFRLPMRISCDFSFYWPSGKQLDVSCSWSF